MRQRVSGRGRRPVASTILVVGLILAALAAIAGCSRQSDSSRASVQSCTQFGVSAIRHHVVVTSLPPQCQGLTRSQLSFAVGSALHSAAIGARGKAAQRERIGAASRYLERMVSSLPSQGKQPLAPAPAAPQFSRTALGLITLFLWLITVAIGLRLMARWIIRSRASRGSRGLLRRPPALNFGHLGLAVTGLLIWIAYLVTGTIALALIACVLLGVTTALGMAVVFLPLMGSPQAARAAASGPPRRGPARRRRSPVFAIGSHIVLATLTLLAAILTAAGIG